MGAERTQKGAVGQQLAASGKARRAEKIRRDETGGGSNIGRDISRGVIEDRMLKNDEEGKQKQGKSGRPGKPIDRRPMPEKPPRDTGGRPFPPKEGRPFEPPKETYDPPRGDRPPIPMPPKEGRPIGDDQFPPRGGRPFPGFPGRPPGEGYLPGRPPGGRPDKTLPSPIPPREDLVPLPYFPPKGDRPIRGKDQFGPGEIPGRPPFGGKKGPRRGGTDFGPGRGDRLPEETGRTEDTYFDRDRFNEAKDMLNQPGGEKMLREFMEKLRSGGIR